MSIVSFAILCDTRNGKQNVNLQIGYPEQEHNPIHFQATSLAKEKGVSVPSDIMTALQKIYTLSLENNVDFGELADYAMKQNQSQ